jgi:sugar phosphate isomerase/epimerase
MNRRLFLAGALGAPAASGKARIDLARISVLTDECGKTPEESIAFAKQYGLRWVELRDVPGKKEGPRGYIYETEAFLTAAAGALKQNRLKVSFLNTGLLKFQLPGTELARPRQETAEQKSKRAEREQQSFDSRMEDLNKAIRCAEIFEVRKIRVFTFSRVANPPELFPKIAGVLNEMAVVARKKGVQLLIENEGSQNVATSAELVQFLTQVADAAVGINWDPVNGMSREKPFPDGYNLLPKKRLGNVQMKARALIIGPDLIDWSGIFSALAADGYKGEVGLETHVFDGTLIEKAHLCMKAIQRLVGEPA